LVGKAAAKIKYIGCLVFSNALVDLAHSGIAWDSRMGAVTLHVDDGIEDENAQQNAGCRGK